MGEVLTIVSTAATIVATVVGLSVTVAEKVTEAKEETQYFEVLPGEFNKEVKLAKERKEYGDKFNPSYEEYIETLRRARIQNRTIKIKWERHWTKSQWTAYLENK